VADIFGQVKNRFYKFNFQKNQMKKLKFTEEQIVSILILKSWNRIESFRDLPKACHRRSNLLKLEEEVRWAQSKRAQA
jgi:hypothetical protein